MDLIDIKNHFFISGNSFSKGNDIFYVRRFDNSIYKLDNGKITTEYNVDFKKHSFRKDL